MSTVLLGPFQVAAAVYESFLEPFQTIELTPLQRELIEAIHVSEGQRVEKGALLVSFDRAIVMAQLEVAKVMAKRRGRTDSSAAIVAMRKSHLEDLEKLENTGHVRPKELAKARSDLAIAQAELLAAQEERAIRQAELERIRAHLAQKELKAPIAGIVLRITKEVGELIRENDVEPLLTIIQTYPLRASFYLPESVARTLTAGQTLQVKAGKSERMRAATVEYVAPVIDPQSNTVLVKLLLDEGEEVTGGMRCIYEVMTAQMDE
ncbi:MAG: efflux RND transporter periplasmic adaptor subunit [Desulfofustis sp.]|nr:efflux RND transporter periplasmic adaptor subunit [Desulfofustis sp.]